MTCARRRPGIAFAALAAFCLSAACTSSGPARAQPPWQSLDLLLGDRSYDHLGPVEDQTTFGLEYVYERPGDDFGIGLGLTYADEEDSGVEVQIFDLSLGLRRSFDVSDLVRPYLGLGLTLLSGEADASGPGGSSSDDDIATGYHLRAGLLFDLSDTFHVGLDLRSVFGADLDLDNVGGDGDCTQLALVAGFSF